MTINDIDLRLATVDDADAIAAIVIVERLILKKLHLEIVIHDTSCEE